MTPVFHHESSAVHVESAHGFTRSEVGLLRFLVSYMLQRLRPLVILLYKPLMQVYSYLSAQRLGQDQNVPGSSVVRLDILIVITHGVGHTSDDRPGVQDGLAPSNEGLSFLAALVEPLNHLASNYLSLFFSHLSANTHNHKHMVDSVNPHRVDIAEDVAAGDATLQERVFHQGVEKVCG
jgi:hypothetical protein